MRIFVSDSDTAGHTGEISVDDGTTVGGYFRSYKPGKDINKYNVRVNEGPANASTVLSHGARLTIAPSKLGGAVHQLVSRAGR